MDLFALFALLVCVAINRPSRQWVGVLILSVFSIHYILSGLMLDSESFKSFMVSAYSELWQWPYFLTAAIADSILALLLIKLFKKSSLRRDILWLIVGIIAVDTVGFLAYISYQSGAYYSGVMVLMNALLIIRLMILTRRDKDGFCNYRCSDIMFRMANTGSSASHIKGEARR